jgi:hypothetical protein
MFLHIIFWFINCDGCGRNTVSDLAYVTLHYIALSDRIYRITNYKGCSRKWSWFTLRSYCPHLFEGTEVTQDNRSLGWDLNLGPLEYAAEVRHSVSRVGIDTKYKGPANLLEDFYRNETLNSIWNLLLHVGVTVRRGLEWMFGFVALTLSS